VAKAWLMMLGVAAGLVAATTMPAQAATLDVCPSGCPYTTIQQALAAAASGDTISVAPGTYPGGFTIGKNVTVAGSASGQTTVRGTGRAGVGITVAAGVRATIEALTVDAAGGDAVYNDGTLTLRFAAITGANNNEALANFGGTLTVDYTTVSGNNAPGIFNYHGAAPTVGTVTIYRSTITGNGGPISGGIENGDIMTIGQSTITGNAGERAGGIDNFGALAIWGTTIGGNNGGGISNGVSGTTGPTSTLTLRRVTIEDNSGGPVGGIWNGINGLARLDDTRVIHNTGLSFGGIYNQGRLTLTDSIVRHNIPNNCVGC
jgi:hypothetical protein